MPSSSLEDHDIFVKNGTTRESLEDCPSRLKDFLNLILEVELLKWDHFGGTLGGSRSVHATPIMQYQSELKLEADGLAIDCRDPKRADDSEEEWVKLLSEVVFYRFDRRKEEVYDRKRHHHCFICGKHFPLRSRPLLNKYTPRVYNRKLRSVHGDDKELDHADVCRVHKNISNFDIDKPTFLEFRGEGKKIPDRTIGLLAWSENAWHLPPDMNDREMDEILMHPSVRPFRKDVLHSLQHGGYIEPLFAFPQRVTRPSLTFPFAVWEAKKASEGNAVTQNALPVRRILEWQQAVAERANIGWEPLVFHFVSAGSEMKVYACHIQASRRKVKSTYPFRLLWSGDCINPEKALQLLYLIDLVALWGQFQYKPFAGACIEVFRRGSSLTSFLSTNFLEHQKDITIHNFPSLRSTGIWTTNLIKPLTKLQRAGTDTSVAELEKQMLEGFRQLTLKNYFIPEKDGFIWLMHRQLRGSDLVVIRVNIWGNVLPPLVIFNSSDWDSQEFESIIYEEKARMPQNVETDFRYDKRHRSVLRKCFDATDGYCTKQEIQFCAILPLRRRLYSGSNTSSYNGFQSIENLLGLQRLVDAARWENHLWCTCRQPEADCMILCDATTCATGWYHNKCVGLDEGYEPRLWMCDTCITCLNSNDRVSLSIYDNGGEFEEETHIRSYARIQRVRSLRRAWNKHDWPDPSKVRELMYKQICCEIEMETSPHKFYDTVGCLERDGNLTATQCWAVVRDDPRKMTHIRERFRGSRNS